MPPGVEPDQNPSTFEHLCACGCGASVRPGQRWREPACKARAYRARQQEAHGDYVEELEDERQHFFRQVIERTRQLDALERAYRELWEAHQACPLAPPEAAPPRSWFGDAFAVLGVRPDAELEAIEGAYKALAKKYHHDHHPGDPIMEERMKAINAAHALVLGMRGQRRPRR